MQMRSSRRRSKMRCAETGWHRLVVRSWTNDRRVAVSTDGRGGPYEAKDQWISLDFGFVGSDCSQPAGVLNGALHKERWCSLQRGVAGMQRDWGRCSIPFALS